MLSTLQSRLKFWSAPGWLSLWLLVASLAGCDRNIEPFEPGEEASPPDLARIFPAPAGEMGASGAAQEGGTTRGAVPPSRAEASASPSPSASPPPALQAASALSAAAGSEAIEGTIEITPELAGTAPQGGILFVIARPGGGRSGPPLAVLRIADPVFPLSFRIGPENVMIPSMQFKGPISLSARLDSDGNATTKGEDDLSSETEESLSPGATGVELTLSKRG